MHSLKHFIDIFLFSFGHYDFSRLCNELKQLTRQKGESLEKFSTRYLHIYCRFPSKDIPLFHEWFQLIISFSHEHDQSLAHKSESLQVIIWKLI